MRLKGQGYVSCPFQRKVRFLDSYQFVSAPLADMVTDINNLHKKTGEPLENLFSASFDHCMSMGYSVDQFRIYTRGKFAYPFEYCKSWQQMNDRKTPPLPEHFSSVLKGRDRLEPHEYAEFLELWEAFGITDLGTHIYDAIVTHFYIKVGQNLFARFFFHQN